MSLLEELNQIIRLRNYKHLAPNGAPIFKASKQSLKFERFHEIRKRLLPTAHSFCRTN
jgi:hypothetical protein